MQTAFYEKFGPAKDVLQIGEREPPPPTKEEVKIEVKSSGINPSDVKKRAGQRGEFPGEFVTPHSDGAGVIIEVGGNVPKSRIGERVWIYEGQHNRLWGTAAEAITLPAKQAVTMPASVSFSEGAAIGIPMMTAHRCLTSTGSIENKTVLITGGLGRVGFYAIQMARHLDAKVITTVGDKKEAGCLSEMGAELVVNYNDANYPEQIREFTGDAGLDLVVDVEFGQNFGAYLPILKDNSTIATYSSTKEMNPTIPFYEFMFKNIFIHPILVYSMPEEAKTRAIDDITRFLTNGKIRHRITKEFPLTEIVDAHEFLEQGKSRGSVVLTI